MQIDRVWADQPLAHEAKNKCVEINRDEGRVNRWANGAFLDALLQLTFGVTPICKMIRGQSSPLPSFLLEHHVIPS
jgi:hypothetical protein